MKRKDFIRNCVCGVCTCAAAGAALSSTAEAAEPENKEDWRVGFMKKRYGALLGTLAGKMDAKALDEALFEQGRFCASSFKMAQEHKGDLEGFLKEFKEKADHQYELDREKGTLTLIGQDKSQCFCPFVGPDTPKVMCNCSTGWMQQTFMTVLGKKIDVTLEESILRGGKRCTFRITGI